MASYRYERDIDPKDLKPRKQRQYSRKERWANWWDYNLKRVFIFGIAGFQQTTGTSRYLDDHLPKSDADSDWWNMVYRWTDCPVLTGMALGSCTSDAVQSASGDSQQLLADYYIGIRGAWLKESASLLENSEPLWANLTAGAVSTAVEGH